MMTVMPHAAVVPAPSGTATAAALEASEARMRDAERLAGLGTWEAVPASGAADASDGLLALLGSPVEPIAGVSGFLEFVVPEDRELVIRQLIEDVTAGGIHECEFRVRRVDGVIRNVFARAQAVARLDGSIVLRGATLDVTDLRAAEDTHREFEAMFRQGFDGSPIGMALTDPLNGRLLRVNDAGCRLLDRPREQLMSLSLVELIHPDDLPDGLRVRTVIADGAMDSFEAEIRYLRPDGETVWCSLHVVPIRAADGQIRANFCHSFDITDRKTREVKLERQAADAVSLGRIRSALDEDLLLLLGQPIIDLETGETVQHELLLRMCGPDGELIPPGQFLPVAERYGLITELDCWVVRHAAERAAQGMAVGVNLSAASVGSATLMLAIENALAETGADPSLLMFEVTETALMDSLDDGRAFVEKLTALGCKFALDDFGTGFGTFVYLKHLPLDYLKIDIQFVRDLLDDAGDERVVEGIVNLASQFGVKTIAEGVENQATLERLSALGVDYAQGFHIGRPAPTHEISVPAASVVGRPPDASDRIALVRAAFDAFVDRNADGMEAHLQPDVELRPLGTAARAGRTAPYRGYEGMRQYIEDLDAVWDNLELRPQMFQLIEGGVAVFGEVIAQAADGTVSVDVVWVWKLRDGLISSIQVFQA